MRTLALATLFVISLFGCSAEAPVAQISYLSIKAAGYNYHLQFASDVPILELFSGNKHQRVVFAELVCSLDADHDFDIEHRLRYFVQGGFEFVHMTKIGGKSAYVFDSDIGFWEASKSESGSDQSLGKEELKALLAGKESIPCTVRMTVNFSRPYYSKTFFIPAKDVLTVVNAR